jgi:transcriptional regulator with XRE-family HTH domain
MDKYMKKRTPLPEKLKSARKSVGLSQRDMGKILKLSDKAVSSYEVGRAAPSFESLRQISEVTKKPITYFLEDQVSDEATIDMKIKTIEQELSEIKAILLKDK